MLSADDLTAMAADLDTIIADNSASITLRRGDTTLAAQTVRAETAGRGRSRLIQGDGSEETRGNVVLVGDKTFDVQKDDRFTLNGQLYRVTYIRPNTQIGVQAEAEQVQ